MTESRAEPASDPSSPPAQRESVQLAGLSPARVGSSSALPYGPRPPGAEDRCPEVGQWPVVQFAAGDGTSHSLVQAPAAELAGHAYGPAWADLPATVVSSPSAVDAAGPDAVPARVIPPRLVTPGDRLGAAVLDLVLAVVTLGVGWLAWALLVWSRGQSPAKYLLGHVVVDAKTGARFTFERMFVRDVLVRGLVVLLANAVTFGVFALVDCCFVFAGDRRTLHDLMSGSIVRYA